MSTGIVAAFSLGHDRLDWSLPQANWAFSAVEPYAMDARENKMALATANSVRLIDMDTGQGEVFSGSLAQSGTHSPVFADGKRLLVGSSGFDAVIEFDTGKRRSRLAVVRVGPWYHRSKLGHYVVRSEEKERAKSDATRSDGCRGSRKVSEFGVPTRQNPAHLNSARYDSDGKILVTLFHQGAGYVSTGIR